MGVNSSLKLCLGLMLLHVMELFVTSFTCLILQEVLMELPGLWEHNEVGKTSSSRPAVYITVVL